MTEPDLATQLGAWAETDITPRLVWTIFECIPGAPAVSTYRSLEEARMLCAPELDDAGFARALTLAASPEIVRALQVADAVDKGDVGISVFTGLRSALTWFFGDRAKALDTDAQQGADAALKAAAVAWLGWSLFPGGVADRVAALRALPAGEALLAWYAAVELALPFADDAALASGSLLGGLVDRYGHVFDRLDAAAGAGAGKAAVGMLGGLTGPVDELARSMAGRVATIAAKAAEVLPPAIATAGTVAGAAATAADALPVYRYLVARLAAEVVLTRALRGAA